MVELKRGLGFWTLLSLTIASIMGTGLFFGASTGSRYSGNALILAWIVLSIVAVYISFYFAELVSIFPRAGGVYEFSKHTYGRFFSFLMGWDAWIVGNLTTALLIVAAIDYIIPDDSKSFLKISISVFFIIMLNLVAYFGIETSGFLLVFFAIISVAIFFPIIFAGLFQIKTSNYFPFFSFGLPSIFVGMFLLSESFFGWESATYLSEETRNPEKNIPKALVIGTIIVGMLGLLSFVVSLGIVPWQILSLSHTPLSDISETLLGRTGMNIINAGIVIALLGSAASSIITMPRLILALARDKLFIAQFSDVHQKFKTPYKAIIFQTLVSLIIFAMVFGRYNTLLSILLPLGFFMYFFIILSVPILRRKYPHVRREFKVPFVKTGTVILIFFMLGVLSAWIISDPSAFNTLKLGLSLVFFSVPIYLMLETYYNPDAIIKINDLLAYLTLWSERIVLPKKVRNEIIGLLGSIKGKNILEFGCSVGTLTIQLAESVNPNGKVYATDLSENDLLITKKRLVKRGHEHVTVIHDEHQINRVHPSIPPVDAIVSIGMMGYLQDVKKVLREMHSLLPYGGKIVFADYVDFFKFIPNVAWLSNDKAIEKVFRDAGFSVYVKRTKGLFWNYVFVYGIKFHENIPYI